MKARENVVQLLSSSVSPFKPKQHPHAVVERPRRMALGSILTSLTFVVA